MSHDHSQEEHSHEEDCCSTEIQTSENWVTKNSEYLAAGSSLFLLLTGIFVDYFLNEKIPPYLRIIFYLLAYLPVGWPVWKSAFRATLKGELFNEFILMGVATIGAFCIGEYPEAVAVMLFYTVGELFQGAAVRRAKSSIKALLDQRPEQVIVLEGTKTTTKKAETITLGEILQLRPGDKLALDGELLSEKASFNAAALTGESIPQTKHQGEQVWAGMINLNQVCEVKVTHLYSDSQLSKIIHLVQDATSKKAPTELFIRKFARIYTPIVFFCALAILVVPVLFSQDYIFKEWLYRSLIFLVVSCPCALVISIPLGYFGGIGAGSRNGILFKGSSFLDRMAVVRAVAMDKTGTLTKGVFKVQEIIIQEHFNRNEILSMLAMLESKSSHPIAKAIVAYAGKNTLPIVLENTEEIAGHGLKGTISGKEVLAGNLTLMKKFQIPFDSSLVTIPLTLVAIAVDKKFAGYLTIADEIKEDASQTIDGLKKLGIEPILLSGDKIEVVRYVADRLNISKAYGELLPEDKVKMFRELKNTYTTIAFAGDGMNDAPVIALSDVGIAMGGLGSEASIETADMVIQNDMPSKIVTGIKISKATKQIVWQNIALAFGVKLIVLILGAGGIATMWEAVFADVGVAFLAILNAMRIQRMKF